MKKMFGLLILLGVVAGFMVGCGDTGAGLTSTAAGDTKLTATTEGTYNPYMSAVNYAAFTAPGGLACSNTVGTTTTFYVVRYDATAKKFYKKTGATANAAAAATEAETTSGDAAGILVKAGLATPVSGEFQRYGTNEINVVTGEGC